jgi:preprotein translocase SecF subunit
MIQKMRSFSFTKHFKIFAIISAVMIAAGLVGLILSLFNVKVFNYDVDFTGGTSFNYNLHMEVTSDTVDEVKTLVKETTGVDKITIVTSNNGEGVLIKTSELDSEKRDALNKAICDKYNIDATTDAQINSVSPSVGSDLKKSAVIASILAIVLILVYIGFRFEFRSGIAAICCLLHDILVMLSMYVIFQIPFNTNFIAAALTILGYSINATIVVFDRIRENKKLMKNAKFDEIVDTSIWDTFTRSLNTTLTTLFVMVMLLIFGVDSIRNFALPLCIGIVCGCYSSVCISGPLWNLFRGKKKD